MIIKSMTRKTKSFNQLLTYINRENASERHNIYHNFYDRDQAALVDDFMKNAALLPKRKNGVMLYHEILSITKPAQISKQEQIEKLHEIAQTYIQKRAPNNFVFAGLHDNKKHNLHYHIVISSNEIDSAKRMRLSKAQFTKIQRDLERHVLNHYPELEQECAMNKRADKRLSKKAAALKQRTGRLSQTEQTKQLLSEIFEKAETKEQFYKLMEEAGFKTYVRGKSIGIEILKTGRKHRLKTLGLIEAFANCSQRIEQNEQKRGQKMSQHPAHKEQKDKQNARRNAFERKPSMLSKALDKGLEEIDQNLQVAANFIRGPDMNEQERQEQRRRAEMKQIRKEKSRNNERSHKG